MTECGRSTSQLLASLQARKDTLEAKLHDKTQELKTLCIREAELTGFLPPEIPLEPGESPPQFRRRVGTAFTYPENLLNNNNVKTKEEECLAALELEYKIQKDIADAALGMANDTSLGKAVRRKHRQVYQKSQRRLADLEVKLHHFQQNLGFTNKPQQIKQRKKPRPPLDNDGECQEHDPILNDEGISLSPIGPLHQDIETENGNHRFCDIVRGHHGHHEPLRVLQGGVWHSSSFNGLTVPVNQEPKVPYYRHASAYHHPYPGQHYSTLPTAIELGYMVQRERLDQGRSLPGYWLRYETDLENLPYSTLTRPFVTHQVYQSAYDTVDHRDIKESVPHRTPASSSDSSSLHNHEHTENDRFGSLDRQYTRTASHSSSSPCLEAYGIDDTNIAARKQVSSGLATTNYYSTGVPPHISVDKVVDSRRFYTVHPHINAPNASSSSSQHGGGALLPSQMYPEHSLGVINQGLTRTQSLGSVETSVSTLQSHNCVNSDTRSVKDQQRNVPASDTLIRKQKEKEWYETSLDSAPCSVSLQRACPPSRRPSGHSLNEMKIISTTQDTLGINQKCDVPSDLLLHDHVSDVSSDLSRSSSNVSSEQHCNYPTLQAKCQEVISPENFDTVVPFESPKNHMVVQAGKWQPYREVTKPFEMADFYKYSTKFRKQVNHAQANQRSGLSSHSSGNPHCTLENIYHAPSQSNCIYAQPRVSPSSSSPTPQQKGIYQPLQPMTCQPIDPAGASSIPSRNRVLGPSSPMVSEAKRTLESGKSLADAFSTEMLEWYQDQNAPRSATLV